MALVYLLIHSSPGINYWWKQASLVFYYALFPRLARYMPHVQKARDEDLKEQKINQDEYDKIESMERNHISNISTAHASIGYVAVLVLSLSVLIPMQGNLFANNLALCLTNSCKCHFTKCNTMDFTDNLQTGLFLAYPGLFFNNHVLDHLSQKVVLFGPSAGNRFTCPSLRSVTSLRLLLISSHSSCLPMV